jgi:hypothetical protein
VLGPRFFDRVEIRRIGRQISERGAARRAGRIPTEQNSLVQIGDCGSPLIDDVKVFGALPGPECTTGQPQHPRRRPRDCQGCRIRPDFQTEYPKHRPCDDTIPPGLKEAHGADQVLH